MMRGFSPTPSHNRRGFTLLEMTIALAMVALLGASLYASMAVAFRARTSAARQTEASRDASIAMSVIEHELSSVLPPGGTLAGPFVGIASGNQQQPQDTVEFRALGRDPLQANDPERGSGEVDPLSDGPRWVQLALRTDLDPPGLVRRVERNLLASVQAEPVEEVLLTGVRALGLRYFDGYEWKAEWDSSVVGESLPLAVEVTLELIAASPTNTGRPYRVVQIIPLSCARPDQIAAVANGEAP